jgi:hypothetical protein
LEPRGRTLRREPACRGRGLQARTDTGRHWQNTRRHRQTLAKHAQTQADTGKTRTDTGRHWQNTPAHARMRARARAHTHTHTLTNTPQPSCSHKPTCCDARRLPGSGKASIQQECLGCRMIKQTGGYWQVRMQVRARSLVSLQAHGRHGDVMRRPVIASCSAFITRNWNSEDPSHHRRDLPPWRA